jgi:hypothetical protein
MRRMLLAVAFVALLASSSAHAVGIDLNWDNCLFSAANRVANKSFDCDNNTDGPFQIFGSIRTGVSTTGVTGWAADIDITFPSSSVLVDWWRMGSGDCRDGGISFAGLPADMPNSTPCNKALMSVGTPIVSSAYAVNYNSRVHYVIGVLGTTPVTMSGPIKYQLFRIDLNTSKTIADSDTPAACAGCESAACFTLRQVLLYSSSFPPDGFARLQSAEIANWLTWQDGVPSYQCFASTPTTRATWGEIKSLYR